MAKQVINVGSAYNDPDTDHGRPAMIKCNENFTELYDDVSTLEGYYTGLQSSVSTIQGNMAGLVTVRISIGTWNMDSDATKAVAWALPANRSIATIDVMIHPDGSTAAAIPLNFIDENGSAMGGFRYDGTNFQLTRTASGTFDNSTYDGTSVRRGWITVQYGAAEPV